MLGVSDNKKKIASLIIASINPDKIKGKMEGMREREGEDKDHSIGYESCAEEMMESIKSGDAKGFVDALSAFIDMKYSELEGEEHEKMRGDDEEEEYRKAEY